MSTAFPGTALLGVVNDIAVDGGINGSGALSGTVTNRFTLAASTAVPEPATSWLLLAGLAPLLRSRYVRKRL
jgi:hypothetical protein